MTTSSFVASLMLVSGAAAALSEVSPAHAGDGGWKEAAIADALLAGPPSVTADATVLGWTEQGTLAVARYGSGPYTCVASGAFSIRVGKPALPYPDPMCLDRNAWSFVQALWSGDKSRPMPTAPGLVWMLAGMNVTKSAVDVGASTFGMTEATAQAGDADVVQMTPHVMIMPLPFAEEAAGMKAKYNMEHPLDAWIMAAGKPHEHLMVHFSEEDAAALMAAAQ